jgi:transposase
MIEQSGKHWVSEIEKNRNINWQGSWTRVDIVAEELKTTSPKSFHPCQVKGRNGEIKSFWAFTKVVGLKKYGKKRLVIAHETEDLSDNPRFLLTDALHWEITRIIQTWNYRWSVEVFHEFAKQITGLESSQVRKEEAVKRHFRLSCVAQSLLQRVTCQGQKSERFKFAKEKQTIGQRVYSLNRQALANLLSLTEGLFSQGQSSQTILELLMPA